MDKTQEQYLDEVLRRATAFEELIRTKGWEHVKAYYQARIGVFLNDVLNNPEKPISDYEGQRNELIGIKRVLGLIDSDLQTLAKFREEEDAKSKSE